MTENSGKDGAPSTPTAKPVRVVGSKPAAPTTSESSVTRPASSSAAPSAAKPAAKPASAKPAAATAPSGAGGAAGGAAAGTAAGTAAGAAKKAAPATKAAPAKKAAPATQPVPVAKKAAAAPVAPAPSQAPDADETAVRPGFGERFKSGLDKASAKASATAEAAKAKAKAGREEAATERTSIQVGSPVAAAAPAAAGGRQPRHARLRLSRVDPWSVARVSFLLSVAFGIVLVVATTIIMMVLGAAGVWDAINSVVASVASSSDGSSSFDIRDYVGTGRVLGLTLVVSVVNVVLLTAMATLGAYLYNMAAALLGGIDVTLSEEQD